MPLRRRSPFGKFPVTRNWQIIIPVFNPPAGLLENLEKLEAASPGSIARMVMVDDGSTNDIPRQAEERFSGLTRLQGDGSLWWCGAMRMGMSHALANGAEVVVWLNHDCVPVANTLEQLVETAAEKGNGAVSAWCFSAEAPEFPVNPGFRDLKEIPVKELRIHPMVAVHGVNGNCVALNAGAIRAVGLPDAGKHPHYGDGPYTFKLHQAGYRTLIVTGARAALEREYDRCVSVTWRCAFWPASLADKLRYYFFSRKSKFHWRIKYHDTVAFRGYLLGPIGYAAAMARAFMEICRGHWMRSKLDQEQRLRLVCAAYQGQFPRNGLIESLLKLDDGK